MLEIRTLGGLSVQLRDGHRPAGTALQPRRLAVLALVGRAGPRGITRDRVLSLLWPDAEEEAGRKALNQALYQIRAGLDAESLFLGTQELRLNPELAGCDVLDFEAAMAAQDWERGVSLYEGPFLDGFRVPNAADFERWADDERTALTHRHTEALERLAHRAGEAGDAAGAVRWWRRLAARDPLNARVALRLMEALVAAGDRAAALQHARIYEALVAQELDLGPDREVVALAERLRAEPAPAPPPVPAPVLVPPAPMPVAAPEPAPVAAPEPAPIVAPAEAAPPPALEVRGAAWRGRRGLLAAGTLAALLIVAALAALPARRRPPPAAVAPGGPPSVVVGLIADFRTDRGGAARPLADMLATNLARVEGLRVVSPSRVHELLRQLGAQDTAAGAFVSAARQAGAAELVEGTLYARPDGLLRLDLRRVDIASGAVRAALRVEGADVFALADSGTARLVRGLGVGAPRGSIADVTTRSELAYRVYDLGVRAWYAGRTEEARRLLDEAVRADSTFAMAAYYRAQAVGTTDALGGLRAMRRAAELAAGAGDRERLLIRAGAAALERLPQLGALAESLVVRFPSEVEGHYLLGYARMVDDDFAGARAPLERALAMDSLGLRGADGRCVGCRAVQQLVVTYVATDSMDAAVRLARRWAALQPRDPEGWMSLAAVLSVTERWAEADAAHARARALAPGLASVAAYELGRVLRRGAFGEAEALVRRRLAAAEGDAERAAALWDLAVVLRHQGRMREAVATAREERRASVAAHRARADAGPTPGTFAVGEAAALLDAGDAAASARLFGEIAALPTFAEREPSAARRARAWTLLHAASARHVAGDTAALRALAGAVAAEVRAGSVRSPLYVRYVEGLLADARGEPARAEAALRASLVSPTIGYTRANLVLARVLRRAGRAAEGIAPLQAALRGDFAGRNFYVTHTELHEALAEAWDAAAPRLGAAARDSAAAHWRRVADAWAGGDPAWAARAAAARARLAAR